MQFTPFFNRKDLHCIGDSAPHASHGVCPVLALATPPTNNQAKHLILKDVQGLRSMLGQRRSR
eukprot:7107638-Pyramimonas_sp.AAC.1